MTPYKTHNMPTHKLDRSDAILPPNPPHGVGDKRHLYNQLYNLDLKELFKFLGTKEAFSLIVAVLQSSQSNKHLGCTNRAVSSLTLLAEVSASNKVALNGSTFSEERSRCSKGSFAKASSTNGSSHEPLGVVA